MVVSGESTARQGRGAATFRGRCNGRLLILHLIQYADEIRVKLSLASRVAIRLARARVARQEARAAQVEWDAPAIVLDVRPYGEGDAVATVMTAEHGSHRGLARGGASRSRAAVWQPGNLVQARWVARLSGHFPTRDAFGQLHRPLPSARQMLYDRVEALVAESAPE
jgi:hypothetical protein